MSTVMARPNTIFYIDTKCYKYISIKYIYRKRDFQSNQATPTTCMAFRSFAAGRMNQKAINEH